MNKYIDQIGRKKEKASAPAKAADACTQPQTELVTRAEVSQAHPAPQPNGNRNYPAEGRYLVCEAGEPLRDICPERHPAGADRKQ